ncbi:MAG: M20/M25/M40 family metallo-hydrolase [Candidatus Hodarchaeales archaeon]|jgi:succinyl-diaminopimelate desuccinylase
MDISKEPCVFLLRDLIQYNTTNNPSEGIYPDKDIIQFIREFVREWIPSFRGKIFEKDKYSSIYLTNDLTKPCDILFMGHLDVVPTSKGWNSDPFALTVKENKFGFGRGSKDCKGSVVSSMLFLQSFSQRLSDDKSSNKVGLFLSTDEETGGENGVKYFFNYVVENELAPKYVINVDGGPKVVYKRRAGFKLSLNAASSVKMKFGELEKISFNSRVMVDDNRHSAYFIKGVDTHALLTLSKYLHNNPNMLISSVKGEWIKNNVIPNSIQAKLLKPIDKEKSSIGKNLSYDENLTQAISLLRSMVLLEVPTELPSEFGVTVNPNLLSYSSNEGTNIHFDVRVFLSPENKGLLIEALNRRLGSFAKSCKVQCSGSSGFFYTDLDNPLVIESTIVMKNHQLMGENQLPSEQEGASDARYATFHNIPVIDLGPKGGNIHGPNEFIDLESMIHFSKVYNDIVSRLIIE